MTLAETVVPEEVPAREPICPAAPTFPLLPWLLAGHDYRKVDGLWTCAYCGAHP